MGKIPGDPSARQAWLERWAEEQLERESRRKDRGAHLRESVVRVIKRERRIDWLLDDSIDRLFDRGLGTRAWAVPETATGDSNIYVRSVWHILPRALRAVGASDHDVLVDFGCGKGRVVHQAARWPLKRGSASSATRRASKYRTI